MAHSINLSVQRIHHPEAAIFVLPCMDGSNAMRCILTPTVHVIKKRFMDSGSTAAGLRRAQHTRRRQVR